MTSKVNIPRPSGPHSTGAVDVMVGRNKEGTLMRIFYPSQAPDINTQRDRWTNWYLGHHYTSAWGQFLFPLLPRIYSSITDLVLRNVLVPTIWEAPVKHGTFPVVIYSHGLLANRSVSSTTCADIASHGYIVAAVEHRDGSACGSFVLNEKNKKEWLPFLKVRKGQNDFKIRQSQIQTRTKEVSRALDILEFLNADGVRNDLDSTFDLSQFSGKLDLAKPIVCGHSFGGATSLLILASDTRFKSGIMLDPWMFPIKDDIKKLIATIQQPLLFILMETFQNKDNLEAMKPFQDLNSQFITIRKAHHLHQTDVPTILPRVFHWFCGCRTVLEAVIVMHLNNKIILKFILENNEEKSEWVKDYKTFLGKNKNHLVYKPQGTAKSMMGWNFRSNSKMLPTSFG